MCTKATSRGSALILAVIAVLVVTTIGIAMLRMTYREVAGSTADAHQKALVACAEAARVRILSDFHAFGTPPDALGTISGLRLGTTRTAGTTKVYGGHYDTPSAGVQLEQVNALSPTTFGPPADAKDVTNVLTWGDRFGSAWKVGALCTDGSTGRQLEIEFGLKFGM